MKRHLQKYCWLYCLSVATVAIPIILIRLQFPPGIRPESVEIAMRWIDSQLEERYGESILDEYSAASKRLSEGLRFTTDLRLKSAMALETWAPALDPDLDTAARVCGDALAEMAAAGSGGVAWDYSERLLTPLPDGTLPLPAIPDFLPVQSLAKMHRLFAKQAIGREDWEKALEELNLCAEAANPIRGSYLIGHLVAVAVRTIAYAGYEGLLGEHVPVDVKRRAVADLRRHRESDPVMDRLVMIAEKHHILQAMAREIAITETGSSRQQRGFNRRASRRAQGLLWVASAASSAASLGEKFEDPALRAMARRIQPPSFIGVAGHSPEVILLRGLSWTRLPAMAKFTRLVLEREPAAREMLDLPDDAMEQLDAWTLALIAFPDPGRNYLEGLTRGQVGSIRGYLTEAALAAEIYRAETGQWPESIDELDLGAAPAPDIPGYATPLDPTLRMGFPPSNMDRRDVADFLASLWGRTLPLHLLRFYGGENWIRPDSSGEWGLFYEVDFPSRFFFHGFAGTLESSLKGQMVGPHPGARALQPSGVSGSDWESTQREMYHPQNTPLPVLISTISRTPLELLALAQALEQSPRYVRDVRLQMTTLDGETHPLDAEWARLIADLSDQMELAKARQGWPIPPDLQGEDKPEPPAIPEDLPIARKITLTARLVRPQNLLAIWADGPDGINNGGMVTYDSTNGTFSRGDIVTFLDAD